MNIREQNHSDNTHISDDENSRFHIENEEIHPKNVIKEVIELLSITQGQCEGCSEENWLYRVKAQRHPGAPRENSILWCRHCCLLHARATGKVVWDHLKNRIGHPNMVLSD